jgi:hypothetical protein
MSHITYKTYSKTGFSNFIVKGDTCDGHLHFSKRIQNIYESQFYFAPPSDPDLALGPLVSVLISSPPKKIPTHTFPPQPPPSHSTSADHKSDHNFSSPPSPTSACWRRPPPLRSPAGRARSRPAHAAGAAGRRQPHPRPWLPAPPVDLIRSGQTLARRRAILRTCVCLLIYQCDFFAVCLGHDGCMASGSISSGSTRSITRQRGVVKKRWCRGCCAACKQSLADLVATSALLFLVDLVCCRQAFLLPPPWQPAPPASTALLNGGSGSRQRERRRDGVTPQFFLFSTYNSRRASNELVSPLLCKERRARACLILACNARR